ncbi:diadenosine tetraphosphatase ApaH/serine/threonine PP2A family protein phosphatase [Pullulanibacillus pueri]|uniref:Bis(5'-nucleosyl)-tetraphosphatase PrpE [asymmetrical] n=1 Tax=Pullulanibacillus pueri TaxID=1437324 RepID=A0A8J3EMU1_9BACL|nr:bis(5'-nucleosyl)-tetraphosphatase PrpE [Pullulanibacillus pueri]MBM7680603.1 diadenosine tetraphosphatase ApaH/serine/threonine PP2A family protein phosphatase [Pullulanibacillus pueri]GGH83965.1 bis(5'-nucleosyl)-tetraphosphatase PrpE [asymmetrical] [Pullulanibacillus pueri]
MYDCIGDVHGCYEECVQLLTALGYEWEMELPRHPKGRLPVFVGDITDRGPASVKMIQLVTRLVEAKLGLYVPGNHCDKLYRYMLGRNVQIKHGLETTVAELDALERREYKRISHAFKTLYETSPLYLMLDEGKLIVAHAGIKERDIGKPMNKRIKTFVLYGDITGDTDFEGRPIRLDWAKKYHGESWIVYGHTPVHEPRIAFHSINIDTGCVFGGKLTAWRYPEMEIVSVPSTQPYLAEKFSRFD